MTTEAELLFSLWDTLALEFFLPGTMILDVDVLAFPRRLALWSGSSFRYVMSDLTLWSSRNNQTSPIFTKAAKG